MLRAELGAAVLVGLELEVKAEVRLELETRLELVVEFTHDPPTQLFRAGQIVPHEPQFAESVCISTQTVEQHVNLLGHTEHARLPKMKNINIAKLV